MVCSGGQVKDLLGSGSGYVSRKKNTPLSRKGLGLVAMTTRHAVACEEFCSLRSDRRNYLPTPPRIFLVRIYLSVRLESQCNFDNRNVEGVCHITGSFFISKSRYPTIMLVECLLEIHINPTYFNSHCCGI